MGPNEYQKLAARTICPQKPKTRTEEVQLLHSAIGLTGEAGEICTNLQKWLWYGQPLDVNNLIEEYGDALWYLSEGLTALGITLEEVMEANIAKLKKRFPDKYSDERAAEQNRDRKAEMGAVSDAIKPKPLNLRH